MTIETKFSPGEWVWQMHQNRTCELQVKEVMVRSGYMKGTTVRYVLEDPVGIREIEASDEDTFPTKQALLESL